MRRSIRALSGLLAGLCFWTGSGPVLAEGQFISAPGRVDIAYDSVRHVLYIGSGADLLRYDVTAGAFLAPLTNVGTSLSGMDISADGQKLVVADRTLAGVWLVDLNTLATQKISFTRAYGEGGTWTAAWAADGSFLTTSTYQGSGSIPLRRHVPATGTTTTLTTVNQWTMLAASPDHSIIGFAEANSSGGPFGRYRVSDGNILRTSTFGTQWFNFDIAMSRDAAQFAMPTEEGTYVANGATLALDSQVIGDGTYQGQHPIGAAYHPLQNRVYFPWAQSSLVKIFDTTTLKPIGSFDFEKQFPNVSYMPFVVGHAKTSADGSLLFVTVDGGVRYVTTAIAAPDGLQSIAGNGSVSLTWNAAPNATSYKVYQGTSSDGESTTAVQTGVSGTSTTVTGLANGTTYYFRVAAVTPAGTSTPSGETSATPSAPLGAVSGLLASARDGQVSLSWNALDGATYYVVYQGVGVGETTPVASTDATAYTASGLTNGTTYYFRVAGYNASADGAPSDEVSATPSAATSNVTVGLWLASSTIPAGSSTTLHWVSSNATSCGATGAWNGSPPTSGTQTLTPSPGNYTFTLACWGPNGSDTQSATLTVTATDPVVSISLDSTAISVGQGATLSWTATNAASCTAGNAWSGSQASAGSAYVAPASAGSYTYALTCVNEAGTTTRSATLSVSNPTGPTLTLAATPSTITLGEASMLEWSSTDATECAASDAWSGAKPVVSSAAVQPAAVGGYTYSLTCTGPGGTTARSVALLVNPAPVAAKPDGHSGSLDPRALLSLLLLGVLRRRVRTGA